MYKETYSSKNKCVRCGKDGFATRGQNKKRDYGVETPWLSIKEKV